MAPLHWDRLTWPEFVAKLEGYRRDYSERGREDPAYRKCLRIMSERPMAQRAARSRDIVLFLNTWSCHLPREHSIQALSGWIRGHPPELEALEDTTLLEDGFIDRVPEMMDLYGGVLGLKTEIRTMGDTAASKFLHVLLPESFVMWDNNIKPFANGYEDFLIEMHALAKRLSQQAPVDSDSIEEHLRQHLAYGRRKTFAKYLDEYNWYVTVGEK